MKNFHCVRHKSRPLPAYIDKGCWTDWVQALGNTSGCCMAWNDRSPTRSFAGAVTSSFRDMRKSYAITFGQMKRKLNKKYFLGLLVIKITPITHCDGGEKVADSVEEYSINKTVILTFNARFKSRFCIQAMQKLGHKKGPPHKASLSLANAVRLCWRRLRSSTGPKTLAIEGLLTAFWLQGAYCRDVLKCCIAFDAIYGR